MKYELIALSLSLSLLSSAQAADSKSCGIPDSYDSDTYKDIGTMKSLKPNLSLSKLEAAQVLITARHQSSDKIATVADAIKYLTESSEDEEAYISRQSANGKTYTVVLYYPGGNPVGLIFEEGTTKVKAYIEDSTVVCK